MTATKRQTGYWVALFMVAAILAIPSQSDAQDPTQDPSGTLEDLVIEAVEAYPDLSAQWSEVDALRTREEQVSQPFDPMVGLTIMNVPIDSFAFTEHGMTGIQVGARQRFYWPGTLDARAEAARAVADAQAAAIPERVIRLWIESVEPYYQIVAYDRATDVLDQQLEAFNTLRDGARGRYEARIVPLTDVLRVETEINRLREVTLGIQSSRRTAVAQLNGLLNRDSGSVVVTYSPRREYVPLTESTEDWVSQAIETRPAFEALRQRQRAIYSQIAAANSAGNPSWEIGVAYSARFQEPPVGSDLLSLSLGINLPFFSSNAAEAEVDELEARSLGSDFDRDELLRQLRSQIAVRVESALGIEDQIRAIEDELIPSIESVYEAAVSHYSSSHTNIEALIQIQVRLLQLELVRARLVCQHDMQRAYLRAIAADSAAILDVARS